MILWVALELKPFHGRDGLFIQIFYLSRFPPTSQSPQPTFHYVRPIEITQMEIKIVHLVKRRHLFEAIIHRLYIFGKANFLYYWEISYLLAKLFSSTCDVMVAIHLGLSLLLSLSLWRLEDWSKARAFQRCYRRNVKMTTWKLITQANVKGSYPSRFE